MPHSDELSILELDMRRIDKPWGFEIVWAETANYVGKILHINAGHKLSRQYHHFKEETFLIKNGEMILEIGYPVEESIIMTVGKTYHCPPTTIHRMIAVTDVDIIEVSTPQLDDVVRLQDDYGR